MWITLLCLEEKILSILTAVFQALGQVLTFLFPVSESGHSAIFHDFAGRYTGSCSELTGLIHIGMAVGIAVAFYRVFIKLIYEFFSGWADLFKKRLSVKDSSNSRKFMYFTLIPYVFMLIYLIPVSKEKNIYRLLNSTSYNGDVLGEGICFAVTGALLLVAWKILSKNEKGTRLSLPYAVIVGLAVFITLPIGGFSLCATVICVLLICGVNKKVAFRYFVSLSVPILLVGGIIEIVNCVTYVNIISGIIAVVIAGGASYIVSKFTLYIFTQNKLKYFAFYDFAIGAVAVIAGIVELIINRG